MIFVDKEYSFKHPHMLHRHEEFLELLYIASESGRYLVGNHEYAVTAGDFVICNANVPHGEDPFQEHHIQTYCLVLSGAKLEVGEDERPIISLGKENVIGALLPEIYQAFHKKKGYSKVCRHFALGILFLLQRKLLERDSDPIRRIRPFSFRYVNYIYVYININLLLSFNFIILYKEKSRIWVQ